MIMIWGMTMKKRTIALALIVCSLLAATACGNRPKATVIQTMAPFETSQQSTVTEDTGAAVSTASVLENITRDNIKTEEVQIYDFLESKKTSKIALMIDQGSVPLYEIEKIKLKGVILDKLLPEIIEKYDLSQYEYIVTNKYDLTSTVVVGSYEEMISSCSYWDREAKKLESFDCSKTVMVLCEIPHAYFSKNNFEKVDNFYSKNYFIFRNKSAKTL